ncbi:MAG: FAD-dependent oxidoreductase [Nitrososphaerota archaeon]|nr:FAD-dependent oxidoreductase [Nitrososphaerota archaeon]
MIFVLKFDVVIIGGGILGTSLSYWISALTDHTVCVIEKENHVAAHASSRNTGVVHSPFYLDPQKKKKIAKAALLSHDLWQDYAQGHHISWKDTGTIELALDESQHRTLEKYLKWGHQNGLVDNDLELLNSEQIKQREPNVKCHSGLYCKKDASTDYGLLTEQLFQESQQNGTRFLFSSTMKKIQNHAVILSNGQSLEYDHLINCAGGHSLSIAKKFGLAKQYSSLHFRGEYWQIDEPNASLVGTNIYTVAKFPKFPFLDPHWIKRSDGRTEIGPNAVPVSDPEAYSGLNMSKLLSKISEILSGSSKKLLLNSEFLSLVSKEWKSSISKNNMINRVKEFIPKIKPSYFTTRGTAGIRTPIITKEGEFLAETIEMQSDHSLHIINYNSPGATGAPAYSAFLVQQLFDSGVMHQSKNAKPDSWNFAKIIDSL